MQDTGLEQLIVKLAEESRSRFYGKYRGVVSDNNDPEKLGRIRAHVPEVLGTDVESAWALPCVPYAGPDQGLFAIPPAGAGVWIEFEGGKLSRPIWVGGWWADAEAPKNEAGNDATPTRRILKSESGLMASLDDDAKKISISDGNGNNLITIEANAGKIKIQATTKVVVEAPKIELVENSTHPLVFGDDLLNYLTQIYSIFIAHTHPGETVLGIPVTPAPPAPPFPAPQPSMLSTKVTTG
jgi:uncharacterized protein involved in type VI secretion and phage assembly